MKTKKQTTTKQASTKATKAKATKAATETKATKAATPAKADTKKKLSQIEAAVAVLAKAGEAMNCQAMVKAMAAQGLWTSPGGKTPEGTLYSSILRDLRNAKDARFKKVARGQFARRDGSRRRPSPPPRCMQGRMTRPCGNSGLELIRPKRARRRLVGWKDAPNLFINPFTVSLHVFAQLLLFRIAEGGIFRIRRQFWPSVSGDRSAGGSLNVEMGRRMFVGMDHHPHSKEFRESL